MSNKNEYYPLTRLGKDVTVVYWPLESTGVQYELYKEWQVIVILCNDKYGIVSVNKWKDFRDDCNSLYLSLKRFKGKIAWETHFLYTKYD